MDQDIKTDDHLQTMTQPKIPKKIKIRSPAPISKSYFTSRGNFREAIYENLESIYKKRELSKKFFLEALGPKVQMNHPDLARSNHRCLAKRLPRVFKITKEVSVHISGDSDAKFGYQKVILGEMPFLESLKLSWDWDHYDKEVFFESLCIALKRLKHLKNLDLDLNK